jgi:hypothetical protein
MLLLLLCVAAAMSLWIGLGDEATPATGGGEDAGPDADGGDEGGSVKDGDAGGAGGATPPGAGDDAGGGNFAKFLAANVKDEKARKNWTDVFERHAAKAKRAEELETKAAEAEKRAKDAESSRVDLDRRDELLARALDQGFDHKSVIKFAKEHTLDELEEKLDEDARKTGRTQEPAGRTTQPKTEDHEDLKSRLEKLERREEDYNLRSQTFQAIEATAKDEDNEFKGTVAAEVEREIELCRARHQKLPNIRETVKNLTDRLHKLQDARLEKYKAEEKKRSGSKATGRAELSDSAYKKQLENESDEVRKMVDAMEKVAE